MNLLCWIKWFNREKITLFIASLVLMLGALLPWYHLPPQALDMLGTNFALANAGRVLAAILAIFGFTFALLFKPSRTPRLPFWSGLIAVLIFPYLITTWTPNVAFIAAAYQQQKIRVTQHVEMNFSEVQSQWKQNISLAKSTPLTSIFNLKISDSRFFQVPSWDTIVRQGLGYSNSFFEFVGRGWIFTLIGVLLGLLAIYLGFSSSNLDIFRKDTIKLLPFTGLVVLVIVLQILSTNIINYQLDVMLAKGEYNQVLNISHILESWYPPLTGDTNFLKRMAAAGFYGGIPEPSLIYFAQGIDCYNNRDFFKAEGYFKKSITLQPNQLLTTGYLATTLLNRGVDYFNNKQSGAAADLFEKVLQIFPGHVEALYNLMLARTINNEYEKSALTAQKLIETQAYFHLPGIALIGQAHVHLSWAKYHSGDVKQAWNQYRKSINKSAKK